MMRNKNVSMKNTRLKTAEIAQQLKVLAAKYGR